MKPWFVVKRYGFGLAPSGWGWLFTAAYVAGLTVGVVWASRAGRGLAIAAVAVLTIAFFLVVAVTSDHKPWRWRWGNDDA